MKILIKNGHVLDPASGMDGKFDILIENGRVKAVEKLFSGEADRMIDADGLHIMPGFIDLHVHFREPGYEYKETIQTGSMAAARGGFTTVCPMPNTNPAIDTKERIAYLKQKEKEDSLVHLALVGAITIGQKGEIITDMEAMAREGMAAVSEDGKSVMNAALYREAMKRAKKAQVVVLAHCEDKLLAGDGVINQGKKAEELCLPGISNAVEDTIAARDILLAKETGARLHLCHCSTKDSVSLIRWAKENGQEVSGEVCPHHFTLSDEDIRADDGNYKMNPPLRSKEDVEALKQGLKDGTITVIATDHAPHSKEEKQKSMKDAPFGITGLETAFSLAVTELVNPGYLSPLALAACMSYNPARILGIEKGAVKPGWAADLVLVDFQEKYVIHADDFVSKGKNTPFENREVCGRVKMTIVDGTIVYEDGRFMADRRKTND